MKILKARKKCKSKCIGSTELTESKENPGNFRAGGQKIKRLKANKLIRRISFGLV